MQAENMKNFFIILDDDLKIKKVVKFLHRFFFWL